MIGRWMRRVLRRERKPDDFELWLARTVRELRDDRAIIVEDPKERGPWGIWRA